MKNQKRCSRAWLASRPDGPLFTRADGLHKILVQKSGTLITLRFFASATTEVQSIMDLENPLNLMVKYLQAMMLGLLWRPVPGRIHVLGLGGGRLPSVLHHHFPDAVIDCTDIDSEVVAIAREYFGLPVHPNLQITVQDGRDYLKDRAGSAPYDLILVDAFRGVGFSPLRLATGEFLAICRKQLLKSGVLVMNFLEKDPLLSVKLQTVAKAFKHTHVLPADGSIVVFADNGGDLTPADLLARAALLESDQDFSFSISELASQIISLGEYQHSRPEAYPDGSLSDASLAELLPVDQEILNQLRRNDPCPCGSGRKFKYCHAKIMTAAQSPS